MIHLLLCEKRGTEPIGKASVPVGHPIPERGDTVWDDTGGEYTVNHVEYGFGDSFADYLDVYVVVAS